ncbi:ABC transporter substrate-binding protein [Cohnella thailandensis]|uniref:ABC transporter substrate-binding protein n=1 Tax=Cohnella thailandensis TaxID=557557 RepID=A0A841SS51_9BACL|nr:ABC transporter substrate-binding protein [Cohnella thailandensis]MBB6635193.1 ABC transporter substrate-binding protein [Cohnella thailandensis]MBP1974341.1 NitT/TauT family transport system substrate-binding protein [Cohnella thailandensis]
MSWFRKGRVAGLLLSIVLALIVAGCGGNNDNAPESSSPPGSPSPSASESPASESPSPSESPSETPKELVKVKFSEVIRSIFYAPHYIAMSKGFFAEEGLEIDMNTAQGSDKGAAALIAGTADISLVGPETTIYIYNQKGEKTLKLFYQLTMKDGSFLLSRDKLDSFDWSGLSGKKVIGWRPGSAPQMVLNSTLLKEKIEGADVVTNIASTAMAGAFASGQGDYIQLFEPVASTLIKEGKAYYAASLGEAYGEFPETSYVATSDYIANHPEIIQKVVNAVAKATAWLETASDAEIAEALKPFFEGTSDDIIVSSIKRYKDQQTWPAKPEMTPELFETLQGVLIENGVLKPEEKLADMSAVVDMSFVQKINS